MPITEDQPVVTITRRGADRIRSAHVWVYRSDVVQAEGVSPGAVVLVQEAHKSSGNAGKSAHSTPSQGSVAQGRNRATQPSSDTNVRATRMLGSAFYSTASEIAIRMISPKPVKDVGQLIRERVRAAISYRERFVKDTNAYRVIFSEGDFLPGLIVDKYNDILSLQVLTQAWDPEPMRKLFLSELQDALQPKAIVERSDPRVRRLEQLPEKESGIVWLSPNLYTDVIPNRLSGEKPAVPEREAGSSSVRSAALLGMTSRRVGATGASPVEGSETAITTEFHMNGVHFVYDALAGQKTGAFLDQRENYAAAEKYARGEALDVFTYQGGFALHLARSCDKVTGVDSSRPALEAADQNAALNGREIEWIEANAFDLLRDYSDSGRKYDTIVLDPPAFAKSRQTRETAMRGYKELNLRALKMLPPGGILVTCSCSYHVSATDLLEVLSSAALDSHRNLRILENRGQAKDHPSVLGVPETAYLKCLISVVS
jgi:23S rRNA (cytosine1962-C5)-methyltransferase